MDRDTELKMNYEQVANMMERFKEKVATKLEGRWFLIESKENGSRTIEELTDLEEWDRRKKGFSVTPLTIFRKT